MTSNYTLTGKRIHGAIELQFSEGILTVVKMLLKAPLNDVQFRTLVTCLPQYESEFYKLEDVGLTATVDMPSNEKLGLFCRLYEVFKGVKYKVSAADSGKIKLVKVDEDILVFYFNSSHFLFKGKHSIGNLVKYYNELMSHFVQSQKPQSINYPDHFDRAYQNKLTEKECPGYWAHLRGLGLTAKKDRVGNVVDWVKAEINNQQEIKA